MSQIDMRQDRPTPSSNLPSSKGKKSTKARKYVEGESDDEEESGDEGEIEDVILGPGGAGDLDEFDEDDDLDSAFEDEEDGQGTAKPRRKVSISFLTLPCC